MVTNPYDKKFEEWAVFDRQIDLDTISLKALLKLVKEYNEIHNA